MMISRKIFSLLCVGLMASAVTAHATTLTFTGASSSPDGNLSASAVFNVTTGQIQITLTNTLSASAFKSPGQSLSDISFQLGSGTYTLGTATASGQLGDINGQTVSYVSGSPTRWLGVGGGSFGLTTKNGKHTVKLETIGGGQPTEMIAPYVANGGKYTSANGGIPNFIPYVIGPATFTIDITGVTQYTTISNVQFSFGTGPDYYVPGVPGPPAVPEPSSLMLLGTGIAGMAGLLRRRMLAGRA